MSRIVDARGAACPKPVIMTKKEMESGANGAVEVIVDNNTALENVSRFAESKGGKIRVEKINDAEWHIFID